MMSQRMQKRYRKLENRVTALEWRASMERDLPQQEQKTGLMAKIKSCLKRP